MQDCDNIPGYPYKAQSWPVSSPSWLGVHSAREPHTTYTLWKRFQAWIKGYSIEYVYYIIGKSLYCLPAATPLKASRGTWERGVDFDNKVFNLDFKRKATKNWGGKIFLVGGSTTHSSFSGLTLKTLRVLMFVCPTISELRFR